MSDLFDVYPDSSLLKTSEFDELFLAFDKHSITTSEVALQNSQWLADKCQCDIQLARKFRKRYLSEAHDHIIKPVYYDHDPWARDPTTKSTSTTKDHIKGTRFTTGDATLDDLLGGGIPTRSITEIAGESAVGKSNILTQLSIAVQLPEHHKGLDRNAIYISTEHGFETRRMNEMLHGFKKRFRGGDLSGDRIYCITTKNQDELENVVIYRLLRAIKEYNVGLVVIDSIAAHYRSEFDMMTQSSDRSKSLLRIRRWLRRLAADCDVAIVCSNQVSERFIKEIDYDDQFAYARDIQQRKLSGWNQPSVIVKDRVGGSSESYNQNYNKRIKLDTEPVSSPPFGAVVPVPQSQSQRLATSQDSVGSSPLMNLEDLAKLESPKTPFLGLAWTSCLDQRIVLKRYDVRGDTRRTIEVVFSSFCPPGRLEFQILPDAVSMIVYE